MSVTTLDARDELLGYVHDYLSAAAKSGAGDLGRLDFVSSWEPALRSRFLEGMAEALKASIEADDLAPVEAYVRLMRRGGDPIAPQFDPSFVDRVGSELRARTRR
ncbi:MAG: hypothetical protein R8G01_15875 [Ilumatobacteraceae bacterium]|nr:hypothetical protein [Ilumatobacteraceae bacterium]